MTMVEVIGTDEFRDWFDDLDTGDRNRVAATVDMLEELGTSLGFPYSSAIRGSAYALRELRVKSHANEIRIFHIFDPDRQAVLLVGGFKTSDRFYETCVPLAEKIWERYKKEQGW